MHLHRIDHVSLDVRDRRRSLEFYEAVLGLTHPARSARSTSPCSSVPPARGSGSSRSARRACATSRWPPTRPGSDRVLDRLERLALPYRRVRHRDHDSVYFADPDGATLELMVPT